MLSPQISASSAPDLGVALGVVVTLVPVAVILVVAVLLNWGR
jgi:multisubunit Na+/H+ antiporter MnhB subunit